MSSQPDIPPVPRLDPARLLEILAVDHGVSLELIEAAPGGEVGAAFVRWPDGRDGVLTRAGEASTANASAGGASATDASACDSSAGGAATGDAGDQLRLTAEILDLARRRGVPAPRYDLIAPVGDIYAIIQQRLPGAPPRTLDRLLVDQLIAATTAWDGLLADRPDLEPASLYLTESGPGFCLHETLERYDDRTRRLLGQIHEIGRSGTWHPPG